jgi:hypothetical protein
MSRPPCIFCLVPFLQDTSDPRPYCFSCHQKEVCPICKPDSFRHTTYPSWNDYCGRHRSTTYTGNYALLRITKNLLHRVYVLEERINILQHDSRKRKRENIQHQLQWPLSPHPDLQDPDGSSAHVDPASPSARPMETSPSHRSTPKSTSTQLGTSTTRNQH